MSVKWLHYMIINTINNQDRAKDNQSFISIMH